MQVWKPHNVNMTKQHNKRYPLLLCIIGTLFVIIG